MVRTETRRYILVAAAAAVIGGALLWGTAALSAAGHQSGPLNGAVLYVDTVSRAAADQATAWRSNRPADAAAMDVISRQPQAFWVGSNTEAVGDTVRAYTQRAAAAKAVGTLVLYDIPARDCGSYSAGGSASYAAYRAWIDTVASAIAERRTIVVLEPDALPQVTCLDEAGQQARYQAMSYAVDSLRRTAKGAVVYIDIGNKGWLSARDAADRLRRAGVDKADGFSLNVSNFYTTEESVAYGTEISRLTDGAHFIVDTSRNGMGWKGEWCNPQQAALGQPPTTASGTNLVDALLWVKTPGESDGTCNGGPAAGVWWPEYALKLVRQSAATAVQTDKTVRETAATNQARSDGMPAATYVLAAVSLGVLAGIAYIVRRTVRRPK